MSEEAVLYDGIQAQIFASQESRESITWTREVL